MQCFYLFHHLWASGNMTVLEYVLKSNCPSVSFYICISMIGPSLLLSKKKMQLSSHLFVSWSVNCDVFSLRMWSQLRSLLSVWWNLMNSGTKKWPISASGRRRTGLALRQVYWRCFVLVDKELHFDVSLFDIRDWHKYWVSKHENIIFVLFFKS